MSLIQENEQSWLQRFACRVLRTGPVPNHVAFIMDGNRRYARKAGLTDSLQGHYQGFDKLAKTLEWCRDLGIVEVTVYAFSIENFKRSDAEVSGIMNIAREKFAQLLNEKDKIEKNGICFRFIGDLALLPLDIQRLVAEIELFSRNFHKATLNVCMAYTAQDEMTRAVRKAVQGVHDNQLEPCDISESVISGCLDTRLSDRPRLLIRTSGELRLSDFLLWQCSDCCVYFDDVLWPEFSFWNLFRAILHYQRNFPHIENYQRMLSETDAKESLFLESIKEKRLRFLQNLVTSC